MFVKSMLIALKSNKKKFVSKKMLDFRMDPKFQILLKNKVKQPRPFG